MAVAAGIRYPHDADKIVDEILLGSSAESSPGVLAGSAAGDDKRAEVGGPGSTRAIASSIAPLRRLTSPGCSRACDLMFWRRNAIAEAVALMMVAFGGGGRGLRGWCRSLVWCLKGA